jgi:hypothetical protein
MFLSPRRNWLPNVLLLILATLLFISCHKENEGTDIEGVTGYTWKVHTIMEVTDYFIRPRSGDWRLKLNSDGTFALNLDGAMCRGYYTWILVDTGNPLNNKAQVTFSIKQWNNPTSGTADDLKKIMQAVNTCHIKYTPNLPVSLTSFTSASMLLEFSGSAGYFSVYR